VGFKKEVTGRGVLVEQKVSKKTPGHRGEKEGKAQNEQTDHKQISADSKKQRNAIGAGGWIYKQRPRCQTKCDRVPGGGGEEQGAPLALENDNGREHRGGNLDVQKKTFNWKGRQIGVESRKKRGEK